mgnify:CR=1 FL=1
MAFLGDRATELLDRVVVELTEGFEVGDLLVVVECGRGTLSKGKDSLKHRDGVRANVRVKIVPAVVFFFGSADFFRAVAFFFGAASEVFFFSVAGFSLAEMLAFFLRDASFLGAAFFLAFPLAGPLATRASISSAAIAGDGSPISVFRPAWCTRPRTPP